MYVVNDTVCMTEFQGSRIGFQIGKSRRGLLKFPNKDGMVVSGDTRFPQPGSDRIHSVSFGDVPLLIIREVDDV
jgi:hypothetical protein